MTEIITITATSNPADELRIIARRMATLTASAQSRIESSIRHEIARNFANESAGGPRWAALAPATVADRIRSGYPGSHPILVRTGAYRRSWSDNGATDFEQTGSGWEMTVGSDSALAAFHERGTRRMPARPARFIDGGGLNRITQTVEDVLTALVDHA